MSIKHHIIQVILGLLFVAGSVQSAELLVPREYSTIQAAIDAAFNGDTVTVSNGTYTGDGNRDLDFAGKTITVRSQSGVRRCIIDCQASEFDYHNGFKFQNAETASSIVDGFTIRNGYTNGGGGGISCYQSDPTIRNCVISNCIAYSRGGGISLSQSDAHIENCQISNCTLTYSSGIGGALSCYESTNAVVTGCTFSENTTDYGAGIGIDASSVTISGCTVSDNIADNSGGGAFIDLSQVVIDNCTFSSNEAATYGGGIFIDSDAEVTITGSTISDNLTDFLGGAVACQISDLSIDDSTINANAAKGAGAVYIGDGNSTMTNCVISNNQATRNSGGDAGAIYVYLGELTATGCTFSGNQADYVGGAVYCNGSAEATIEDCTLRDNTAQNGGGVGMYNDATMTLHRCRVVGNWAGGYGGGVFCPNTCQADIDNSVIAGNYAGTAGAGLCCTAGVLNARNCTVTGNYANSYGGGIAGFSYSNTTITNSIVWNNSAPWGDEMMISIEAVHPATMTVAYCDVLGGQAAVDVSPGCTLNWNDGNIDTDPNFVAPGRWDDNDTPDDAEDDVWENGCYYLLPGSACLDAGDNSLVQPDETDLEGNDRISPSGFVDLGAYEKEPTAMTVNKVTLKAGSSRESKTDSFVLSAAIEAEGDDFSSGDLVALSVGTFGQAMETGQFKQFGKKQIYAFRGPTDGIKTLKLDLEGGTIQATGKNLCLTGTSAPVPVAVVVGDYYGYGEASDSGAGDVVNAARDIPLQFMATVKDSLTITKSRFSGRQNNVGTLTVQGTVTAAGDMDLSSTTMVVHVIGVTSLTVPSIDGFVQKGATQNYIYKEPKPDNGLPYLANAQFDLDKCTFKLTIKDLDLTGQSSPLTLQLTFGSFQEQAEVPY